MELTILHVTIRNFKCIDTTVALEVSRLPRGLISVLGTNSVDPGIGSNGAGKSTIWDAMLWCFYGKTVEGLRNPDVQPWTGRRNTRVIVRFKLGKKTHKLMRTISPNRIVLDGRGIMQPVIDKLLPINLDTTLATWVLGQDQPLFFDRTPKAKMELFSDVLNLNRWDGRADFAGRKASAIRHERLKLEVDIGVATGELEALIEQIETATESMEGWGKANNAAIQGMECDLNEVRAKLSKADKQKAKYDLAYDGAKTELKMLDNSIAQLHDYTRISREQMEEGWSKLRVGMAGRKSIIKQLKLIADEKCPTCEQPLHGQSVRTLRGRLRHRARELREAFEKGPPKALVKQVEDLKRQLIQCSEAKEELIAKADKAEAGLAHWVPEVSKLEQRRNDLIEQIKEARAKSNPHREYLSKLRRAHAKAKDDLEDVKDRERTLARRLKRTEFWIKGFRDVRLYILEECLARLQMATNAQFAAVGLKGWAVEFAVERETNSGTIQRGLSVFIKSPRNKKPVRWECWSGGEKQRLRLIGSWALAETLLGQVGLTTNMEVVDEPTTHLSPEGTRDIIELLAERAQRLGKRIFYVDHTARESGRYAATVTVRRSRRGAAVGVDY